MKRKISIIGKATRRKVKILGKKAVPLWLLMLALIVAGAGAAVGTILVSRGTGEVPVTVSQALLVGQPVAAGSTTGENLTDDVDNEPQATEVELGAMFLPDRSIGVHNDDQTGFQFAAEIDTGDIFAFWLPLKNASNQDMIVELTLNFPDCIEVEVVDNDTGSDNIENVTRTGYNTWKFEVLSDAEKDPASATTGSEDSILIIVQYDDPCLPGYYTMTGEIRQIAY